MSRVRIDVVLSLLTSGLLIASTRADDVPPPPTVPPIGTAADDRRTSDARESDSSEVPISTARENAADPVTIEPAEPPSQEQIAKWIAQLDSDAYREREAAERKLIDAGPTVIEPLVAAARQGGLEVTVRSLDIFKTLYDRAEGETVDVADDALDRLVADENRSIATRAAEIAEAKADLREKRAVARIVELGGIIVRGNPRAELINGRMIIRQAGSDDAPVTTLRLLADWKGGDEGLRYVRRLSRLRQLYVVDDAVSVAAQEQLLREMPTLEIQGRGKAFLGIGSLPGRGVGGCLVNTVEPGSAAARAGIEEGDMITSFGGKPVSDFKDLIDLIAVRRPGDKVQTSVMRNGLQTLDVEVTLGGWSTAVPGPTTPLPDPQRITPPPADPN